jgi:hypothetical protein
MKPAHSGTARTFFFPLAGKFHFTQVLEFWILGTVKLFR